MRLLRFIPRCALVIFLVLLGLLLVGLAYPFIGVRGRAQLNRTWSRCLLRICGVRLLVRGTPRLREAVLFVANHVSWIDIFVINAVRPTAFVAKAEIRRWPVVGWLVAGAGTLFIERGQRHAVQTVGAAMQRRFARGEAVGLFPEGTTTEGHDLLPFHGSLFEPARQGQVTVQPLTLRFLRNGKRDPYAAFVGEESLVANLWRVLGERGLAVEVVFLPPLAHTDPDGTPVTRLELSRRAREGIRAHLF
ncbi:1-acyl-sn-glycerol-3-phosphate acyltransferase [Bordetella sp. N]|uniref:lysophospholipid acyltransferase family protein n=1 Tax=Bordetella sp. N TaxID=1746199 RepID=UPI00070E1316|nr:lysophospholipid acyltransferase family protein [Bordetella sp. N]ALM87127.1 acyltransferase [Bordetella sp. N]